MNIKKIDISEDHALSVCVEVDHTDGFSGREMVGRARELGKFFGYKTEGNFRSREPSPKDSEEMLTGRVNISLTCTEKYAQVSVVGSGLSVPEMAHVIMALVGKELWVNSATTNLSILLHCGSEDARINRPHAYKEIPIGIIRMLIEKVEKTFPSF